MTFMDTMHGLLKGETLPINEENILPGVQEMMRTMGNHGFLTHEGPWLPPVIQDLVDRGFADVTSLSAASHKVKLTDKGKAYIARIGGDKTRTKPTTGSFTATAVTRGSTPLPPAGPDEPA